MQKYLKLLTVFLIVVPRCIISIDLNEKIQKIIETNDEIIRQLENQENQLNQCREQSKNHTDILQLKINDNEIKLKIKDEIIAKQKTEIQQNILLLSIQENEINKNKQNVTSLLESGNNKINQQNSKLEAKFINSVNELQQENTKLNSQLQNNTMEITHLRSLLSKFSSSLLNTLLSDGCNLNNTNFVKFNPDQQKLLDQCQRSKEDMQKEIEDKKIIQNELNDCKNYSSHFENQLRVTQLNLTDLQAKLAKKIQEKPVTILPKSCLNLSSGIQEIQLPNKESSNVLCDDDGWMIIQRRINGKQDFDKKWQEYVDGFGELDGDFWFGLEKLHLVTSSMRHQLQISVNSILDIHYENLYDDFRIGNSDSLYKLEFTSKLTTADPLKSNVNRKFLTNDKIQNSYTNCAKNGNGGWWYTFSCGGSNLNAQYDGGMIWSYNKIINATMKIRPYSNEY